MADDSILVKLGANIEGLTAGMNEAAGKVESSTLRMNVGLDGLGNAIERVKVPFLGLIAIMTAGDIFKNVVEGAREAAVQLDILAQNTGLAVSALSRLEYAAKMSDVDTGSLQMGLRRLANSMQEAMYDKTGLAAKALQAMGLSATDTTGHMQELGTFLPQLEAKLSSYRDSQAKTALTQALMGRGAAALEPFFNQGAAGIAALGKEADALGITMTTQEAQSLKTYNDAMIRMKASVEGASKSLAVSMAPELTKIADDVAHLTPRLHDLSGALELLAVAAGSAGAAYAMRALAVAMLPGIGEAIAKIPAITLLADAVDVLNIAFKGLISTFSLIAVAGAVWYKVFTEIRDAMKDAKDAGDDVDKTTASYMAYEAALEKAEAHGRGGKGKTEAPIIPAEGGGKGKKFDWAGRLAKEAEQASDAAQKMGEKFDAVFARIEKDANRIDFKGMEFGLMAHFKPPAQEDLSTQNAIDAAREGVLATIKGLDEQDKAHQEAAKKMEQAWLGAFQSIQKAALSAFDAVQKGQMTKAAAEQNMIHQVERTALASVAKKLEAELAAAVAGKAITAQHALSEIAAHAASAAAGAWSAMSSIPYVGPEIAAAVAAATLVGVLALGSRVASAAGGYDIPQGVNPVTQLHAQEMVLPAPLANTVRSMAQGGAGAGGDVHHWNVSTMDAKSFKETMMTHRDSLAGVVRALAREGKL